MPETCLAELDLRNYALGACDAATSERIEEHLARCPACEETLAGFDDTGDTLVRHLPLIARVSVAPAPPAQDRPGWLDRLRAAPPDGTPPASLGQTSEPASMRMDESSAYELLGILGQGGMGVVYRARHRQLGRVVALKVLHPRLTAAVEARQRFEREIRVLGSLHHPGIVMATDAGRIGAASYLVMELIDGIDLARFVRRAGPLSISEACTVGREMAEAIAAAHRAGVVHRDIKPSNVMIDRAGRIKLLDFGLAHLATLTAEDPETSLGQLLGTLEYMAPEQAGPERLIGPAVDLYGLGATLFFLLTGRSPRGNATRRSLLEQLRSLSDDVPDDVRSLRGDVPAELAELIGALLSHDPVRRPSSAEDASRIFATWSSETLADRIAGVTTPDSPEHAEDRGEAARSLSRVLGIFPDAAPAETAAHGDSSDTPATAPSDSKSRGPGRIAAAIGLAAAAAAVWFGVTIFLETRDGTLRIESDVVDVRIEVVDEKEQPRGLTIDRSGMETSLRAGKYRIRFAGEHDGLTISPDTVTLRHGKQEVAKITRVAKTDGVAAVATPSANEKLYQGQPESAWQRAFEVERDPVAKIAEARALISFAGDLAADRQVDRIVEIGGALVEAGWGDDAPLVPLGWLEGVRRHLTFDELRSAIANARGARNRETPFGSVGFDPLAGVSRVRNAITTRERLLWPEVKRWEVTSELEEALASLIDLVQAQLAKVPSKVLAERLGREVVADRRASSAFAASVLANPTVFDHVGSDADAVALLIEPLLVTVRGLDRTSIATLIRVRGLDQTAIATLIRARSYDTANETEKRRIVADMQDLAARILFAPPGPVREHTVIAWTSRVRATKLPIDPNVGAEVVYLDLLADPEPVVTFQDEYGARAVSVSRGLGGRRGDLLVPTLDDVERLRQDHAWYLPAWVGIVNRHLAAKPNDDGATDAILLALDVALRLRLPTDDWDVVTTGRLLTERLRRFYAADAAPAIVRNPQIEKPRTLLLNMLRIDGSIPEFARAVPPAAAEAVDHWKQNLSTRSEGGFRDPGDMFSAMEMAPYESLRLALAPMNVPNQRNTPSGKFVAAVRGSGMGRVNPPSVIFDPLFALAVVADLSGQSEAQDEVLAAELSAKPGTFDEGFPGRDSTFRFATVLTPGTSVRSIAVDLLQKTRNRTRHAALREAVDGLLKEVLPTGRSATGDASATINEPPANTAATKERLYQGQPESVWQRGFDTDRDPIAKITDARALISLASDLPAERQIDRIVEIGARLIEAGWGEDALLFALSWVGGAHLDQPPAPLIRNNRGGGFSGRQAGTMTLRPGMPIPGLEDGYLWPAVPRWAISKELNDGLNNLLGATGTQLLPLPAGALADRLSTAVSTGTPAAASFAAVLLLRTKTRIESDAEAARLLAERLDRPIRGFDQSALAIFLRLHWGYRTDWQRREIDEARKQALTASINELGERILQRPPGEVRKRAIVAWIGWSRNADYLLIDSKTAAEVVYQYVLNTATPEAWEGRPNRFNASWTPTSTLFGDLAPQGVAMTDEFVTNRRKQLSLFLPDWIDIVNRHLAAHEGADEPTNAILRSLDIVLPLRMAADRWDVKTTARQLTERLRGWYASDDRAGTISEATVDTPLNLVVNILRITGETPEFARTGPPAAAAKLQALKEYASAPPVSLRGGSIEELNASQRAAWDKMTFLLDLAPYESFRLAVLGVNRQAMSVLYFPARGDPRRVTSVDPLLLLAVIADRSADLEADEAQRAARVLSGPGATRRDNGLDRAGTGLGGGQGAPFGRISDLSGPTTSTRIAIDLLKSIRDRSQPGELREAAEKLLRETKSTVAGE